jgi:hypothetical protein
LRRRWRQLLFNPPSLAGIFNSNQYQQPNLQTLDIASAKHLPLLLEEAGEMLGIFEAQNMGDFAEEKLRIKDTLFDYINKVKFDGS